jgi:hypothetical protein
MDVLDKIGTLAGMEFETDLKLPNEAYPVSYKAENTPVRRILRDILATAGANYKWGKNGAVEIVPHDYLLVVPSGKDPLFELDMAREEFLREEVQKAEWLSDELTLTGAPSEILLKLMRDNGIVLSRKALTAAFGMKDSVDLSASASMDILTFLQQNLNLGMPRGRAEYPLKLVGTTDEVAEWDRRLEDYAYAREDFNRKQLEGRFVNVQLYQLAGIIKEKTGAQVLVDEQAWKYESLISLEGENPSLRDVLEALSKAGFASILLPEEQTRSERLFIFANPVK